MGAIRAILMAMAAAFALAMSCRAAFAGAAPAVIVSPAGDDTGDGSAAHPVKTLQRAQQLARGALASKHGVNVTLLAGTYRPGHTLVFTSEDSGTPEAPAVWMAGARADVTISGGELLDLRWEPFRDGIFSATVLADCPDDQLLVNGQIQPMARYPNYDLTNASSMAMPPIASARPASPAGLGFANFPMDRFGVVSPELKRLARVPIVGRPSVAEATQRADRTGRWLGIDLKNVATPGEVSATGQGRAEGVLILRMPAEAGQTDLRANDVILQVDGKPVAGVDELMTATRNGIDRPIELAIWRDQRIQKTLVRAMH